MNNCPHIKIQLLLNTYELLIENYDFFFFFRPRKCERSNMRTKEGLTKHNASVDIS